MKYSNVKKMATLALTGVMTVATVGCGASSSNTASTSSTGSTQAATEGTSTAAPQDVTISLIDFNAGASNVGDNAEEIVQKIKDYTGVNLQISWIQTDVVDEKNALALSDPKTMPMIMSWNGSVTGTVSSAAKEGAFVDLTEYLKDSEKYPNLSQANPDVSASLTVDGKLIGIYKARVLGRYGVTYRADWAEKLGLEEPKTIDDIYNMLYAFTYDDPDGNGVDDTIGMEMTSYTGPFDIMQTWFGCGNGWKDVDGKLIPVHQQPEYKEALDWFKKLYDEGLMPSDWAERTTDTWSNGCKNGENGMYVDVLDGGRRVWDYFVTNDIKSVVDDSQTASMNLVGAINGATLATSGYNGYFTLSATTCDTPEKIEAALTLIDKMCDDDMMMLSNYGLEGINYEIKDGVIVDLDVEDTTLAANYGGLNQLDAYIPNIDTKMQTEQTERQLLQKKVYAENESVAITNPALAYLTNSATYANVGATLDEILTQARTQYICGEIDEAGLEAAWQSWLDQGGSQIIEEVNAQYTATK